MACEVIGGMDQARSRILVVEDDDIYSNGNKLRKMMLWVYEVPNYFFFQENVKSFTAK